MSGYAWSGTASHATVGGSASCQDTKKRLLRIARNRVLRTVSVVMLIVVAGSLLGPRLYQIYYGEF